MSNSYGKLIALGVGPGASDLMTLRAVNLLKSVDVVAIPEKNVGDHDSFAWQIVRGAVAEQEIPGEKLFLHFPMTKDVSKTVPAFKKAGEQVLERLRAGKDVMFITEGDPSVFSTWSYLLDEMQQHAPEVKTEVIPAVSSITAIPSVTGHPLADGEERFCVVPATYGIDMLPKLVEEFDTIILIKAGRMIPRLIEQLEALDLLHTASYVSHATTDKQELYRNLRDVPAENRYFSMVQLSIRSRKGILRRGATGDAAEMTIASAGSSRSEQAEQVV